MYFNLNLNSFYIKCVLSYFNKIMCLQAQTVSKIQTLGIKNVLKLEKSFKPTTIITLRLQ